MQTVKKLLVVVDMQNDFIDGTLANSEAQAIVPKVCEKISHWQGNIVVTQDTHKSNYLKTNEGQNLPVQHCLIYTHGWDLNHSVADAIENNASASVTNLYKHSFGCPDLPLIVRQNGYNEIEFIGLCTDICVVSNVLLLKSFCPEVKISVDASCCAGVSPQKHQEALSIMESCHIEVLNNETEAQDGRT